MASQQSTPESSKQPEPVDQITVLSTFQREIVSLEKDFAGALESLRRFEQDTGASAVEHLLLLDSACEATQEVSERAAAEATELVHRCLALNKELRGTDKLAERVKQLKRGIDELEHVVDSLALQ